MYSCLVQTMQHILYVCGQDCLQCVQVFVACGAMHSYLCVLSQMADMQSLAVISHAYRISGVFFIEIHS